ncbi:2TM domain-containing protein [Namhaeicola litoreus]|uniref:2TM domain-containing protein n=1 Tax=Namhaeicola litoreus TaxID=1052145 RepID=A0ABW3XY57_9FLAO
MSNLDPSEIHQTYEKARLRTKQKRRLYYHFMLFLVGSVFFIVLNKYMNIFPEKDWFFWAIMIWLFFLIIHTLNVFVFNRFFGEEWERVETEKLIKKHQKKVEKLEVKLEQKGTFNPESTENSKESTM